MQRGDLFVNDGERLVITQATAHRVDYRKEHKRPKRDACGHFMDGTEPYTQNYTVGRDRAELWMEKGYWKPVHKHENQTP